MGKRMFCMTLPMMSVTRRASPATKMYTKVFSSALIAGGAAGLLAGLLQLLFVQPVLLHAELYEAGTLVHFGADSMASTHQELPALEFGRDGLSILFSMLVYCGYALVLVAAMALSEMRGAVLNGRTGILWGIAGYACFQLLPAFSLAPEVPGVAAADVYDRQVWWAVTVIGSAVALWLIAFSHNWLAWGVAALMLLAPHLYGAPEPDYFFGPVPPELSALFAARSLGTGFIVWSVLGCIGGAIWHRSASSETQQVTA